MCLLFPRLRLLLHGYLVQLLLQLLVALLLLNLRLQQLMHLLLVLLQLEVLLGVRPEIRHEIAADALAADTAVLGVRPEIWHERHQLDGRVYCGLWCCN